MRKINSIKNKKLKKNNNNYVVDTLITSHVVPAENTRPLGTNSDSDSQVLL